MTELQVTYGNFEVKGVVTGLLNERSFTEGKKEGNNPWAKISFGVKSCDSSFVYVELMGSMGQQVKLVQKDKKTKRIDSSQFTTVPWGDRYIHRNDNYVLYMPITIEDELLTPYDAAFHIKESVTEGMNVLLQGSLNFSKYEGKTKEAFTIRKVFKMDNQSDERVSRFTQEAVFINADRNIADKKLIINTYIITRKDGCNIFLPYTFVIDCRNYPKEQLIQMKEMVDYFEHKIPFGSLIKVHGNIEYSVQLQYHDERPIVVGFNKYLEIRGGKIIEESVYKESDFVEEESIFDVFESPEEESEEAPF